MKIFFFVFWVFLFPAGWPRVWGQEVLPKTAATTAAQEAQDALPDFSSLRDPFLSALPEPPKKDETPVEPLPENLNNTPEQTEPVSMMVPVEPAPVNPVTVIKRPAPVLQLQGLIWDSEHPQAIVDNEVVSIGDEIKGAKIESIDKEGVEASFDGEKFHVQMAQ